MKFQIDVHGQAEARNLSLNRGSTSPGTHVGLLSIGRRLRTALRSSEEGSAIVELALALPILLAILTAICTFAIGFNNQMTLTSAVGAGAQYLQVIRTTTSDPCADTLKAISAAAPNLNSANISLSFNLNGTTVTGNSCAGYQSYMTQGQSVTVSATYPCTLSIMPMNYGPSFGSSCQLSAQVTEYEY
jgi:Flp pilus assembly protein TadG